MELINEFLDRTQSIKFEFCTPLSYDSDTHMDTFFKRYTNIGVGISNLYHDKNMTNENHAKAFKTFFPRRKYCIEMIPLISQLKTSDIYDYIVKQGDELFGARGLILLFDLYPNLFPFGTTICFDVRKRVISEVFKTKDPDYDYNCEMLRFREVPYEVGGFGFGTYVLLITKL